MHASLNENGERMAEEQFQLFLNLFTELLVSDVIVAAFVLALGFFAFCVFAIVVVGAVYAASFAWAGYENRFRLGDEDVFEYDEYAVIAILLAHGTALWNAIEALASTFINTGRALASALLNNILALALFVVAFIIIIMWDTWHPELIQAAANAYTSFFAPILRTLFLPLLNLITLIIGPFLPLLNGVRQIWASITTTLLLETIICAGDEFIVFLRGIVATLIGGFELDTRPGIVLALINWLQLPSGAGSALDVGIDLFPAGQILGDTIAGISRFTDCICAPLSDIVINPLLVPFTGANFAQFFNATLNVLPIPVIPLLSPVFLTQAVLRPIIRTVENSQNTSITGGFEAVFVEPSFNSTFDTLETALISGGQFVDEYGQALFNITLNIIREATSSCETIEPWSTRSRCSDTDERNAGVCAFAACEARFVQPVGCCVTRFAGNIANCFPAQTNTSCAGLDGTLLVGLQCSQVAGCPVRGCCPGSLFTNATGTFAETCVDDVTTGACIVLGGIPQPLVTCAAMPLIRCVEQTPLTTVATVPGTCSSVACTTAGAPCQCDQCLCRYDADPTPADANATRVVALGPCRSGTEEGGGDPTNPAAECRVPLPILSQPPVPALVTAGLYFFVDTPIIQPLKYFFNIFWNVIGNFSEVFGADGFLFFRINDTIGAAFRSGLAAVGAVFEWLGDLIVEIGNIIAESTEGGTGAALSQSAAVRAMPSLTLAQRSQLNQVLQTEGEAIRFAFGVIADIVRVVGRVFVTTGEVIISVPEFLLDQFFGAIYFSVTTAIDIGFPDVFAYAKQSFGDNATPGLNYTCRLTDGKPMLVGRVTDAGAATCSERTEILELCRSVFQFANALAPGNVTVADLVPPFVAATIDPDATANARECAATVLNCAPLLLPVADPLAVNQFEVLLEKVVDIARALDPLVSTWCQNCTAPELQTVISGFVEPFVPVLLPIVDAVIHIGDIFTTGYLACLDIDGALDAVGDFVANFTDLLRFIHREVVGTGIPCEVGIGARDSFVLCALAQLFDSVVDVFVEVVRLVWHIVQDLVRVLIGAQGADTLVATLSFTAIEEPVRAATFDVFAIVLQIVPRSVVCIGPFSPGTGCCVTVIQDSDPRIFVCASSVSAGSCDDPAAQTFIENTACFNSGPACQPPLQATGPHGCCKFIDTEPDATVALNCQEDIQAQFCPVGPGLSTTFFANQFCNQTGPVGGGSGAAQRCPPSSDAVQKVVAEALGEIAAELLLLLPRVTLGVILRLVQLFVALTADAFRAVIGAIIEPLFEVVVVFFEQLANIAECAGSQDLANAFTAIAAFVQQELCLVVEIVTDFILFVVFLIFGVLQALVTLTFDLLRLAGEFFLRLLLALAFAVFQPETVCGFQGLLCDVNVNACGGIDQPPCTATLQPDDNVDFAVNQCRRFFLCEDETINENNTQITCAPRGTSCTVGQPPCMFACSCAVTNGITVRANITCDLSECNAVSGAGFRAPGGAAASLSANPLLEFMRAEFAAADAAAAASSIGRAQRKRSSDGSARAPSAAFCGSYLATFGIERAESAPRDSVAAQCLTVLAAGEPTLRGMVYDEWLRVHTVATHLWSIVQENHARATAQARLPRDKAAVHRSSYAALLKSKHALENKRYSRRSEREHAAHRAARTALWHSHGPAMLQSAYVSLLRATHLVQRAAANGDHVRMYDWVAAHFYSTDAPHLRHRVRENRLFSAGASARLSRSQVNSIAFSVALRASGRYMNRIGSALGERTVKFFQRLAPLVLPPTHAAMQQHRLKQTPAAQKRDVYALARRVAKLQLPPSSGIDDALDDETLGALDAFRCNETEQFLCTGCEALDNLLGAGEDVVLGLRDFYPNNQTGYLSYVERHLEGFDNTLVNPRGNDTYTTDPKLTPWLFERLLTVQWFWQWNFTVLTNIVTQNGTLPSNEANFVGRTEAEQEARAARVGRTDIDNTVFNLLGAFIAPAIEFAERIVALLTGTASVPVLVDLYVTFIKCDYQGALQCQSPTIGLVVDGDTTGALFDALANVTVFALIGLIVLNLIIPGSGVIIVMVILVVSYFLTMWIAYGASPLCTLPTLVPFPFIGVGVIGVPTCLPIDVYTIFAELLPQCFPVPIALIQPSALPAASTTICSTPGTAPPLQNCGDAAGFLNGFDNFFFTTGTLLPPGFNEFFATTFETTAPAIAEVAALYTPAYIASLGELGEVCNRITLPNLLTTSFILTVITFAALLIAGSLVFFIIAVFWLYWATLLAANEMVLQMDKGFVQGVRVQKLKIKAE